MKIKSLLPELVPHEESFWLFGIETKVKENVTNEYWGTIFLLQCKLLKKLLSTATAAAEVISEIKFGRPAWATFWGACDHLSFPVIFVLLPNKMTETYKKAFHEIRKLLEDLELPEVAATQAMVHECWCCTCQPSRFLKKREAMGN